MEYLPLTIIMFLPLVILLLGCKFARRKEFHEDFLSLESTKCLRGFAAVAVMMHHLSQTITNYYEVYKGPITELNFCGLLMTGIFFFCSGYGLFLSLMNKPDYLKGFIRTRVMNIVIPFYVCNTIFTLFMGIFYYKLSTHDLLIYLTGGVLLNKMLWYIIEIIVLYIAFFIIFRLVKNKTAGLWLMTLFVLLLVAGSLLLGHDYDTINGGRWFHGEWWYNSTYMFIIGMLGAKYKDKLVPVIKKLYPLFLILSAAAFYGCYRLSGLGYYLFGYYKEAPGYPGYFEKLMTLLMQMPQVFFFVLFLLVLSMKVKFSNPILRFLGLISLELYMLHNIFIIYLRPMITNDLLFIVVIYAASVALAYPVYLLDSKLRLRPRVSKKKAAEKGSE